MLGVGQQREDLNIMLESKEIKQVDGFVYLGGMVTKDGHSELETRRRIQAGANAWRKVEGVMLDRTISKKLKGKGLRACVTPACLCGLESVVRTTTTEAANLCEQLGSSNNKNKEGGQKMKDLRKEVGMQCSLTGKLVRNRMRWAGHLVRMDAGKLREQRWKKTPRTQENGEAITEMGGLREEGYEKIGGG